jgi:tripartite-type tricarboxylate transporter receptor subunit TctC
MQQSWCGPSFRLAATGVVAAIVMAVTASADEVADFYKGRQISYIIQAGPGGYYGLNGRLIANHMGRFIPGNPTIIVQHMPGAGGITAANHTYNVAAKDGTVMAMLSSDLAVVQRMHPTSVRYDAAKFNWVGSIYPFGNVLTVYHAAGVKSLDDMKSKPIILGQTSKASTNYTEAVLLNRYLGFKLSNVTGYRGGNDLYLAMERNEIHGRIGSWASLKATKPDWLAENKMTPILQSATKRLAELPDIPTMAELAPNDEVREMFLLLSGGEPVGWSAALPPDVPTARVAALRKAFDQMLKDSAFRQEAARLKADIDARTGAEVAAAVKRTLATPDPIIQKLRELGAE